MGTLFTISWRNIWRNPGRSGVLLAAIVAGLWAGIFLAAISNGFIEQRFERLIEQEISHLQIHHPEFRVERDPAMIIPDYESILNRLNQNKEIHSYTARVLADGMIQSPATTSGVQIWGIHPDSEEETTAISENIVEGEYLDAEARNPVVIGMSLAEKLNSEIGNRIVLTFQDVDNELVSASFSIVGLFRATSRQLEEAMVYTRADLMSEYIAGEPIAHEIAVLMDDVSNASQLTESLSDDFPGIEALTWSELSPELRYLSEVGNMGTYIVMIVILLALAFGILNTMLMAIYERTHELGMLLAIGMNKGRVFSMITIECLLITLTGAATGTGLSMLTIWFFEENGLNMEMFGEGLAEFGYDAIIYPVMYEEAYVGITALVILTAILSAFYPAYKALKIQPAEAIRE